jgi:hypothetical protein
MTTEYAGFIVFMKPELQERFQDIIREWIFYKILKGVYSGLF